MIPNKALQRNRITGAALYALELCALARAEWTLCQSAALDR
jgi:hypothetical protein